MENISIVGMGIDTSSVVEHIFYNIHGYYHTNSRKT